MQKIGSQVSLKETVVGSNPTGGTNGIYYKVILEINVFMTTSFLRKQPAEVLSYNMDLKSLIQSFYKYSTDIKGYSKDTIRRYKYVIDLYCRHSGITVINEATPVNVRNLFFHGRSERKWSANTALVFYKSLLVFFRWCVNEGYLAENPVKDMEKPKLEHRLPKKFTKQDALKLLEIVYNYPYENTYLRFRNHAMFATFIFAGLRKSELLNLRYADVDLENMTIFVNQGKGNKDRFVPVSKTLSDILVRYIDLRKKRGYTCAHFFVASNRNAGFTEHGLKHLVAEMIKASELKFSVHKLRHTFATLMIEGGCDIYSLSRMMGHSDIKTTTIYLYASAEHLKSQIRKHPLNNY